MNWNEFWAWIGIKVPDLIAGLAGGIVNAFVFKKSNPMAIIGSIIVGALTANYLSEPATQYTGTSPGASAFIVGLCGMAICQVIAELVSKWRPSSPKGDNQ
jgi:uncharacterized membrane protein YeaQ/YmgE (transglycosylase-associated protein family)